MKKLFSLPPVSFVVETANVYLGVGAPRSAAALSYFLILTLFPLLVCVNYFIGLFHLDLENLLQSLDQILPADVLAVLTDYLGYAADSQSRPLLLASLFTILVSASAGLRTLLATMDSLHGTKKVSAFRRVLASVLLSALFLMTIYLSVVVIFTGEWFFWLLEKRLPRHLAAMVPPLSGLWRWMRYLLLFCFVLLLVLMVYRAGTPRHVMGKRVLLLSSLLTAAAIAAASVVFSWFIGMSSRYALVYGSLASLIILLVWLYLCGNILLLGAVVGRVLEDRLKR
ncbi:MAG: YihY/virulence factor BrkB family protein [Lawsonibacter sp.]|jgi:membrane protein|nr:YihY/virulence factor BrkB family protein [Lawsonibacter sp.]